MNIYLGFQPNHENLNAASISQKILLAWCISFNCFRGSNFFSSLVTLILFPPLVKALTLLISFLTLLPSILNPHLGHLNHHIIIENPCPVLFYRVMFWDQLLNNKNFYYFSLVLQEDACVEGRKIYLQTYNLILNSLSIV